MGKGPKGVSGQGPGWPLVVWATLAGTGMLFGVWFLLLSPSTLDSPADSLVITVFGRALVFGFALHLFLWAMSRGSERGFGWHPFFVGGTVLGTLLWTAIGFYGGNMWLPGKGRPPIQAIELPVLGKTIREGRRRQPAGHMIVTLDPFNDTGMQRTIALKARPVTGSKQHWTRFTVGHCAKLRYRSGHFGMPIRVGLDPIVCSPSRGAPADTQMMKVSVPDHGVGGWQWQQADQPYGSNSDKSP